LLEGGVGQMIWMLKDILQNQDISSVTAFVVRNRTEGAMDRLGRCENVDNGH
jgi:hypothetical protein